MNNILTTDDLKQLAKDLVQSVKDGLQTLDDAIKLTEGFSRETVKLLLSFIDDLKHLYEDVCKLIMDALIAFHDLFVNHR